MISKSLELSDYPDIAPGVGVVNYGIAEALGDNVSVYIPHPHRMWEYGSAVTAYLNLFGEAPTNVLDIGCGRSPLGPGLAAKTGATVTEIDPDTRLLEQRGSGSKRHFQVGDLLTLPTVPTYDAIFCISVIEHIPEADQYKAWETLATRLNPGGLLFVSTDFGPSADVPWQADTERVFKFDPTRVAVVEAWLKHWGLTLQMDTTFHGPLVYDYTFFRFVATKQ